MPDTERVEKLAQLAALRDAFAASLPERLDALTASWQAVMQAETWGMNMSS